MIVISIFVFLWRVLRLLSFSRALDHYHSERGDEIAINYYVGKFYSIRNRKTVEKVFASHPIAAYSHFTISHPYHHTLDNYQENDREWKIIHKSVKDAIVSLTSLTSLTSPGSRPIQILCRLFEVKMRSTFARETDIMLAFQEVYDDWYYELMAGPDTLVSKHRFYQYRADFLKSIKYTFYDNPFRGVPILGSAISLIRRYIYWNHFSSLREDMADFLNGDIYRKDLPSDTFFSKFYAALETHYMKEIPDNPNYRDEINAIFVENGLLSLLVYDFVFLMLQNLIVEKIDKARCSIDSTLTDEDISNAYKNGFLFPVRPRIVTQDVKTGFGHMMKSKSYVLSDLVSSNLLYSTGARACAGQVLARPLIREFAKELNALQILVIGGDYRRNPDLNMPFIDSDVMVYAYHRNSLDTSGSIPSYTKTEEGPTVAVTLGGLVRRDSKKKTTIMRNLWHLYTNPKLKHMMELWLNLVTREIYSRIDSSYGREIDAVFAPEARALPLTTMINLPTYVLTKESKFGPTATKEYTRGHSADSTTIHLYHTMMQEITGSAKDGIIIDDGIASGGTLVAMTDLIQSNTGCEIKAYIAIVSHSYCEQDDRLVQPVYTMFDFDYE